MELTFPQKKSTKEEILGKLKKMKEKDVKWENARAFSLVYGADPDVYEVLKESHNMFISTNALNPTAFPSLKTMENEVVGMMKSLLGNEQCSGSMTSGVTESILMAVKTAREWARKNKPKIKKPELVVASSVHPAFNKACHYFGIKLVITPVDPKTYKADVEAMRKAITKNTIMLVGSSPQYPQGVIDPIEEIGALALEHKILCHSDSCIGGVVLGFWKQMGLEVPPFDLNVPGVTSLSVDLHKYAYTAKGASVILYNSRELRKFQFYCTTGWTGGIYISPTALGTRGGGSIASAWAVMNYLGVEGYKNIFQVIYDTRNKLLEKIKEIEGLFILGEPNSSCIAFSAKDCDIYVLADYMNEKGWVMDKNTFPPSLHMTVMKAHENVIDDFINDLKESHEKAKLEYKPGSKFKASFMNTMIRVMPKGLIKKLAGEQVAEVGNENSPGATKTAGIYGMVGSLEAKGALQDVAIELLDNLYDN